MAGKPERPPALSPEQPAHSVAQFAVALARNAIPVWGFFRRLTHKRGYEVEASPVQSEGGGQSRPVGSGYASGFLIGSLAFTLVHGIFLAMLLFVALPNVGGGRVDPADLRGGVLAISAFLVLGFLVDLVGLRRRPFAWIKAMADAAFARIAIVHMTIIFGMFAVLLLHRARPLFTIFLGLKFLVDVATHTPQWKPKEAPAWMSRALNRVPGSKGEEDFQSYWKRTEADEGARAAEDELVDRS